jgi:hypothetical protein
VRWQALRQRVGETRRCPNHGLVRGRKEKAAGRQAGRQSDVFSWALLPSVRSGRGLAPPVVFLSLASFVRRVRWGRGAPCASSAPRLWFRVFVRLSDRGRPGQPMGGLLSHGRRGRGSTPAREVKRARGAQCVSLGATRSVRGVTARAPAFAVAGLGVERGGCPAMRGRRRPGRLFLSAWRHKGGRLAPVQRDPGRQSPRSASPRRSARRWQCRMHVTWLVPPKFF